MAKKKENFDQIRDNFNKNVKVFERDILVLLGITFLIVLIGRFIFKGILGETVELVLFLILIAFVGVDWTYRGLFYIKNKFAIVSEEGLATLEHKGKNAILAGIIFTSVGIGLLILDVALMIYFIK